MKTALTKWILYLLTLLVVGPALAWLTGKLVDVRGGEASTLLLTGSAWILPLSCFIAATLSAFVIAWIGAKAVDIPTACILSGLTLAWGAWPLATLESAARLLGPTLPMYHLAMENALCTSMAIGVAMMLGKMGAKASTQSDPRQSLRSLIPAILCGAVAAGIACTLVANTGMKGQTLAGAAAAGVAAAIVIQFFVAKHKLVVQPVYPMLSIAIIAAAGPIAATFMHGGKLEALIMAGKVMPLARPMSFEWPAGGLIGTALGMSWASGALERHS